LLLSRSGVSLIYKEAVKWYRKAAEQVSKQATEKVKILKNKIPKQ